MLLFLSLGVHYMFLNNILHGLEYLRIIQDELPEEVYLAQEGLHSFLVDSMRNLCDSLDPVQIHLDLAPGNFFSNEVTLSHDEYAILGI